MTINHPEVDLVTPADVATLDALFEARVQRTPAGRAYHYYDRAAQQWQTLTWVEVQQQVARWRAALAAEALPVGSRIAIALRNSPEWVFADQAALSLGLVVVPLYVEDRADNTAYILQDSGARLLFVHEPRYWERLRQHIGLDADHLKRVVLVGDGPAANDRDITFLSQWLPATGSDFPERPRQADDLASIVYTSGTTGRSKGVMLSHHNMFAIAHGAAQMDAITTTDMFLSFLPLSHTLERTAGYYMPMLAGACVGYSRSVQLLADDLGIIRPTIMIAVPRIFEKLYARIQSQLQKKSPFAQKVFARAVATGWRHFEWQQGRGGWSPWFLLRPFFGARVGRPVMEKLGGRLRFVVSGGAALGTPVAKLFIGLGLPVLQGYGLTETSPVISVNQPGDNDPCGVGRLLPGVTIRIADNGELLVKSPGVMQGYLNRPEDTRAVIDADGWLHTGDQAAYENGHLRITGRIKDILVLSNGEKIPPGDMESAITLDGCFEQALVVGEGQAFLSAILVLNAEQWRELANAHGLDPDTPQALLDSALHNALLRQVAGLLKDFPGYAKVRKLVLDTDLWSVENGLLTPTLKVKRNKVLEHYHSALDTIYKGSIAARG